MKRSKATFSSFTLRLIRSSISFIVLEEEGDDTSVALAMRHLADWIGTFSLGDSKRDEGVDEVMVIAATSLVVSSSSLSPPDMYSSLVTNTILEGGFLLGRFFLKNGFLLGDFESFLRISLPPCSSRFS